MSTESCEVCGRPGTPTGYRYPRVGGRVAYETSADMKRCYSCKRRACDVCLVVIEETADDHFIRVPCCAACLEKLRR